MTYEVQVMLPQRLVELKITASSREHAKVRARNELWELGWLPDEIKVLSATEVRDGPGISVS